MKTNEVLEAAKNHLAGITQLKINNIMGVSKENDEWHVLFELVEKKSIPDAMDLLGIYDVTMSADGELVKFERKGMRKRGDASG